MKWIFSVISDGGLLKQSKHEKLGLPVITLNPIAAKEGLGAKMFNAYCNAYESNLIPSSIKLEPFIPGWNSRKADD